MQASYFFNIASMAIILVVLTYQSFHSNMGNARRRIFLVLMILSMVSAILSVAVVFCARRGFIDMAWAKIINTIVLLLNSSLPPLYFIYVVATTDTFHKIRSNKLKSALGLIPYVVIVVSILANEAMNGFVFTVNPIGTMLRGRGYAIIFVCEVFYGVLTVLYIRHCRYVMGGFNIFSLVIPVVFVAGAMLGIALLPEYDMYLFCVSMCFLLLLLLNRQSEGLRDSTTGFFTQVAFAQDFNAVMSVGKEVCIIVLTITNYRTALDIMGHEKTQNLIEAVAQRIRELLIRESMPYARCYYHDDGSFTIMAPKEAYGKSNGLAHEFATSIMKDIMFNSIDLELYINVCMVECPQDIDSLDGILMLMSDLLSSKPSRNVLKASDYIKTGDFELRKQMSMIIDRAILNKYLQVYYQPIYSVENGNFHSAEALIRLIDPEYGFISPAVFIPIAEKTGAIHKIGSFVLEEVCKFIASPQFEEIGLEYIEVNLSAAQCLRRNLIDEIMGLTAKYGINPKQLNLEITETAECFSQDRLLSNIVSLFNRGFSFSLDDFGTGYSNLLRMASLPLSIIKLDRTFVLMGEDPAFHCVIINMVSLFKEMGLEIVVEGIETKEMIDSFSSLQVDYIQGFYFSKPLPKKEFVEFISEHNNKSYTGEIL